MEFIMRNIRNIKHTGFTYTQAASLSAITDEGTVTRVLPPVAHVDVRPKVIIDADLIDMVRDTTGATPVFHRWHRQAEVPTALGLAGEFFAS